MHIFESKIKAINMSPPISQKHEENMDIPEGNFTNLQNCSGHSFRNFFKTPIFSWFRSLGQWKYVKVIQTFGLAVFYGHVEETCWLRAFFWFAAPDLLQERCRFAGLNWQQIGKRCCAAKSTDKKEFKFDELKGFWRVESKTAICGLVWQPREPNYAAGWWFSDLVSLLIEKISLGPMMNWRGVLHAAANNPPTCWGTLKQIIYLHSLGAVHQSCTLFPIFAISETLELYFCALLSPLVLKKTDGYFLFLLRYSCINFSDLT